MQSLDEVVCFPFPLSLLVAVTLPIDFLFAAIVDSTEHVDCCSVVLVVYFVVAIGQATMIFTPTICFRLCCVLTINQE